MIFNKYRYTAAADRTAKIWDAKTGQPKQTLEHNDSVTSAVFSPDGQYVVTNTYDKTAKIWDAQTGQPKQTLQQHDDSVTSAAFSPDGQYLATTSKKTTKIWNLKNHIALDNYFDNNQSTISQALLLYLLVKSELLNNISIGLEETIDSFPLGVALIINNSIYEKQFLEEPNSIPENKKMHWWHKIAASFKQHPVRNSLLTIGAAAGLAWGSNWVYQNILR